MLLGRRAECDALDRALVDALAGRSRVVVLRGEAGSGKSALLGYLSGRLAGWRVATAVGIESEMELAYSGLHQLCASMLDNLDRLPGPQRDVLATVFGQESGPAPDRFLVGLATLTLLAELAEQQPLVCVIDDAQWLDAASAQILGFVARRLLAERVALVCAARTGAGDSALSGLPALFVDGLNDNDARNLLLKNLYGPLDTAVCDQIVAESHGNPLALLELPRTWSGADLAGGFGFPARQPVAGRIEQSYATRFMRLPADTRMVVLAAAAEPLGNPVLLQRAAEKLGLGIIAAEPAVDAELIELGTRVAFVHPLVRSASYRSATGADRRRVHLALAEATDPAKDPDRHAWHLAGAAAGPDEQVAVELEQSASRAQARGGLAAAAAFLERSALLSPDPARRARRALEAAAAKQLAGAPQSALMLLATAVDGPLDELESAMAQRLKGQIALDLRRGREAAPLLLEAAGRLENLEPRIARATYLEALRAGSIGGRLSEGVLRRAAHAVRNAPASGAPTSTVDLLLTGLATRFTDGYAASAPTLKRALAALRDEDPGHSQDVRWPGFARRVAPDLFDDETWHILATQSVQLARDRGALGVLPIALNNLAALCGFEGDLEAATALLEEADAIAEATGMARIAFARMTLAAFRGDEAEVWDLVEAGDAAARASGEGVLITFGEHARALLYNGLGRYDAALPPAESASTKDELCVSEWSLPELVEAAARFAQRDLAAAAVGRLSERTQAAGTQWALGIEARSRALLDEGGSAEELYREAIDRLGCCRVVPERARAHLLYGEWLRRGGRRNDAREQLHVAHDLFAAIGMNGFAERTRRELLAAGDKARKRTAESRGDLTPQEAQIAQLAREGHSNPEIGAQLFLSPRTVEWHLRSIFTKLNINSRKELDAAMRTKMRNLQPV
jgi:DNA-binding CsgD family transcriptional regulator